MSELSGAVETALAVDTQYNWAAMFTAYASGSSLEDISATFACPMPVLRRAATAQDWAVVASRLVTPAPVSHAQTEGRMAILERNRARNYEMADLLREKLIHDFAQLRHGTLKVEKALAHKGQILHTDVAPGPQEIAALANAAKTVAEMTYRALGDVQAEERGAKGPSEATSITVILPTVVHQTTASPPPAEKQVIDLRPREVSITEAREQRVLAARAKQLAGPEPDPTDL